MVLLLSSFFIVVTDLYTVLSLQQWMILVLSTARSLGGTVAKRNIAAIVEALLHALITLRATGPWGFSSQFRAVLVVDKAQMSAV